MFSRVWTSAARTIRSGLGRAYCLVPRSGSLPGDGNGSLNSALLLQPAARGYPPPAPVLSYIAGIEPSCVLPDLVEDLRRECGFVLREKTPVMLLHDIRRVLNGIARLLVGAGLFENVGRQDIAQVVRPVR